MTGRVRAGLCLLLFVLTGCYTLKTAYKPVQWLGAFPADCSGYLAARNYPARLLAALDKDGIKDSIIDGITNNKDIRALLEKTESLYCAFKLLDNGTVEYYCILLGNYPYFPVNLSLNLAPGWKRKNEPAYHFIHSGDNLKIAIPDWYLILITNGNMELMLKNYRLAGRLAMESRAEAHLAAELFCYFPDFTGNLVPDNLPFNKERLPARAAWVYGEAADNAYMLGGAFVLQQEEQALLFLKGFKLFLPWWLKESRISTREAAGKLRVVELAVEDSTLFFTQLFLTLEELANGLEVFSGSDD